MESTVHDKNPTGQENASTPDDILVSSVVLHLKRFSKKSNMRITVKTLPLVAMILVCGLCILAAADDHNAKSAALTANPVYQKDCAKCHGKTAEGRHFGGPSLVSDKTAAASADDLRGMITNGKGRMPKFGGKLGATDIDQLVQQIVAANQK
jgi:mono/diheme cytochrome c family protein